MRPQGYRLGTRAPTAALATAGALGAGLVAALLATGFLFGSGVDVAVHPAAMAVLLAIICVPIIRWAVAGNERLFRIAVGGMALKAVGTYLRIELTGTGSDAQFYNFAGRRIAGWLSEGFVWPNDNRLQFRGEGTTNLSYIVGWVYRVVGERAVTAYVVFAFISFAGCLLFYRAATTAIPQLDKTRYAQLLFYTPSMLFWPSSLGKDAWMIGCLGLAAFGASGLTRHRYSTRYVTAFVAGLVLAGWIRPHMAALTAVALVASIVWPTRGGRNRTRQLIGVLLGFVILSVALGQVADQFGSERFEVTSVLDQAEGVTAEGNSEFKPWRITGPHNFVPGAVSVIFRPLPIEASNSLQLVSSLESIALLALVAASIQRLKMVSRTFLQNGYFRFVVIYSLGFVIAFSVISNFGILARQRAQLWPFLLVLLALSPKPSRGSEAIEDAPTVSTDSSP